MATAYEREKKHFGKTTSASVIVREGGSEDETNQLCDICRKKFKNKDEPIIVENRRVHSKCHACKKCKKELGLSDYVIRNKGLSQNQGNYCEECYYEAFGAICNKCHLPIRREEEYSYANKRNWHRVCLFCYSCGAILFHRLIKEDDNRTKGAAASRSFVAVELRNMKKNAVWKKMKEQKKMQQDHRIKVEAKIDKLPGGVKHLATWMDQHSQKSKQKKHEKEKKKNKKLRDKRYASYKKKKKKGATTIKKQKINTLVPCCMACYNANLLPMYSELHQTPKKHHAHSGPGQLTKPPGYIRSKNPRRRSYTDNMKDDFVPATRRRGSIDGSSIKRPDAKAPAPLKKEQIVKPPPKQENQNDRLLTQLRKLLRSLEALKKVLQNSKEQKALVVAAKKLNSLHVVVRKFEKQGLEDKHRPSGFEGPVTLTENIRLNKLKNQALGVYAIVHHYVSILCLKVKGNSTRAGESILIAKFVIECLS